MDISVNLVKPVTSPRIKVLFLGYAPKETRLIDGLIELHCEVWHTEEQIKSTEGYDLVISYGFKHILKKDVIKNSTAPIINLHISYLPWNRGAHPNFWSFYDCTPSGVTIHLIDEGLDTGPIIYQRYVNFNKEENTYAKTYKRLIREIEELFMEHVNDIISKKFVALPQRRKGTYHSLADLPQEFEGWNAEISKEIVRLDIILNKN